jgi:hypothetical protein
VTSENITFTGNGSAQRFVNIPQNAYLYNSYFYVDNHNVNNNIICYQETANVSTVCGGLSTGKYKFSNALTFANSSYYNSSFSINGNWDSGDYAEYIYTDPAPDPILSYLFINYTKPNGVTSAIWQTKGGNGMGGFRFLNTTIPTACFDSSPTVRLIVIMNLSNGDYKGKCYSTTGIINILQLGIVDGSGPYSIKLNEEGIYWLYSKNITKPRITVAGTTVFSKTGVMRRNEKVNISSVLNSNIKSCTCTNCTALLGNCSVPIKFYSNSSGLFEYKNIIVNYTYIYNITMINEKSGLPFLCTNLTSCILYQDYNRTLYNFKTATKTYVDLLSTSSRILLRLELIYPNGDVVNRYFDTSLLNSPLKVCVNNPNITHYENLLSSTSSTPIYLYSPYADCWASAYYTQFSYLNTYSLNVFTTNRPYTLYYLSNGNIAELAQLNGGLSTTYNVDNLVFNKNTYNLNYNGQSLSVQPNEALNEYLTIYYQNPNNDNIYARVVITNQRTGALYYDNDAFTNYNLIQLSIYTPKSVFANNTIFKVVVTSKTRSGSNSITRYFTNNYQGKKFNSGFGIFISFLILIFGLTWSSAKNTFSWFGIVVSLIGIIILNMASTTWQVLFFNVIYILIFVYQVIIMVKQNPETVA